MSTLGMAAWLPVRFRSALLLVTLASSSAAAQSVVRGMVRDSAANFGIAGAIVEIRNATFQSAVRSDESGAFNVSQVPAGAYQLTLLRIGYRKVVRELRVSGDAMLALSMTPVAQSLAPIKVGPEGAG